MSAGADHGAASAGEAEGQRDAVRPPDVVLVGLPGAGKSTVGARLAGLLGRAFLDLDAELERRIGRTVAQQFAEDGEAAFRDREVALSDELARRIGDPMVLAPGGGWVTNAAARLALGGRARTVYLRVRPETAARRLAADPVVRPLLARAADPTLALARLLARRGAYYEASDAVLDADVGTPDAVAAAVAALAASWQLDADAIPASSLGPRA